MKVNNTTVPVFFEFKTPLSPLTRLLSRKEFMYRNASQPLKLVNQFLELSKIEEGKVKLNLIYGNVSAFLKEQAYSFGESAKTKRIAYDVRENNETKGILMLIKCRRSSII